MVRMETWVWMVIAVVIELLLLIGAAAFFVRTVEKKAGKKIGILYVNADEAGECEGVYAQFYKDADPKSFTDGTSVIFQVRVLRK